MKLHKNLLVVSRVETVHQDQTKSGVIKVWHKGFLVMTKQWNGVSELSQIKQEIQAVTKARPVLRLVA